MSLFLPSNNGQVPSPKQGYHGPKREWNRPDCSDWRNSSSTGSFVIALDSFIKRVNCSCALQSCFPIHVSLRKEGKDIGVATWVYLQGYQTIHDRTTLWSVDQWADIRVHIHKLDPHKHDFLSSGQEKAFNKPVCFINAWCRSHKLNEVGITVVLKFGRRFPREVN
jgi:hypothetical protein